MANPSEDADTDLQGLQAARRLRDHLIEICYRAGVKLETIAARLDISSPDKTSLGKSHSLSWQAPDEVRTLSVWLRLGMPALAEDASKGNSLSSLPGAL